MWYFIKQALLLILVCEPIFVGSIYFLLSKVWLVWAPVAVLVPVVIIYMMYKRYDYSKRLISYYEYRHQKDEIYYAKASDVYEGEDALTGSFVIANRGMTFVYFDKGEEIEIFFPYDEITYSFDKMLVINYKGEEYRIRIIDKNEYQQAIEKL